MRAAVPAAALTFLASLVGAASTQQEHRHRPHHRAARPNTAIGDDLASLVNREAFDERALRARDAQLKQLSHEREELELKLDESEQANEKFEEMARLAKGSAVAEKRKYRVRLQKVLESQSKDIQELQHKVALCKVENSELRQEVTKAGNDRSAQVNASLHERSTWKELVSNLTRSYDVDETRLGAELRGKVVLEKRAEAAEDDKEKLAKALVGEKQKGDVEIHSLKMTNWAQALMMKTVENRAKRAAGNVSDLMKLRAQDSVLNLKLRRALGSAVKELKSARGELTRAWALQNASDSKLVESEHLLARETAEAEQLRHELNATRTKRMKEVAAERHEDTEILRLHDKVNSSAAVIRGLQAQTEEAKQLLAKDKDLIGKCRGHAKRLQSKMEEDFKREVQALRANLSEQKRSESETAVASVRSKLAAANDALQRENAALASRNGVLQQKVNESAQALQRMQDLSGQYEALLRGSQRLREKQEEQNRTLHEDFRTEYAAMKKESDGLKTQNQELKDRFRQQNEQLQRENRALAALGEAAKQKYGELEKENQGLFDQNQALLRVVAELRAKLETAPKPPGAPPVATADQKFLSLLRHQSP